MSGAVCLLDGEQQVLPAPATDGGADGTGSEAGGGDVASDGRDAADAADGGEAGTTKQPNGHGCVRTATAPAARAATGCAATTRVRARARRARTRTPAWPTASARMRSWGRPAQHVRERNRDDAVRAGRHLRRRRSVRQGRGESALRATDLLLRWAHVHPRRHLQRDRHVRAGHEPGLRRLRLREHGLRGPHQRDGLPDDAVLQQQRHLQDQEGARRRLRRRLGM